MSALADLDARKAEWFAPRASRLAAAVACATAPPAEAKALTAHMDDLATHMECLGWVNELLPDAEAFLQQALAVATDALLTEHPGLTPSILKVLAAGKVTEYTRLVRQLERLSATLTHRLDAMRTLISAGRELAYLEGRTVKQG